MAYHKRLTDLDIRGKLTISGEISEQGQKLIEKYALSGSASGAAGENINGAVFITDIEPTATGNVGGKTYLADSNDKILTNCFSTVSGVRVHVIAMMGTTNVRPAVTVNGTSVGNWNYDPFETDNRSIYQGYADINLNGPTITALHEDGPSGIATVVWDQLPIISNVQFSGGYPGSQTELKSGDRFNIQVETDIDFVAIEIDDNDACSSFTSGLSATSNGVINSYIADRGDTVQALGARVRVQKSTGAWSDWRWTNAAGGTTDGTHLVNLNNLHPTVDTMTQSNITYPGGQEAIKSGENVIVHCTVTDFDTIQYSSPTDELSIPSQSLYLENKTDVEWKAGGYNVSTPNYQVSATRAANDATTTRSVVVYVANSGCEVSVNNPSAYFRTGGNDGTSAQNVTITITSTQNLLQAPTLVAPIGTWQGVAFTGSGTSWTRDLSCHDDDSKGTHAWGAISAKNLANIETTTNDGDSTYTFRGFVSRTIALAAFQNEANLNVDVTDYNSVALSWSFKTLTNQRAVGTTATPDPDSWCLNTLSPFPNIIRILDTAATDSSSQESTITIEEV